MKKSTTKKDLRKALNDDIEEYLRRGGEVHSFARGESGLVDGRYNEQAMAFDKRQERTPVPEVLKAIDDRKEARKKSPRRAPQKRSSGPKKKVIYDDFGEPLRVIWED
ncbi:hypothetical protein [Thalassolituus sp.]|jgi:hypothetical protein|uniref:hypothetical protein n=1 Tax=Thalassolituus sp. TaxID=2030822 RepID=UPI00260C80B1|nr:hypothetical protein [uncultured Thalassolituus sp.]TNC92682.1 MAG: hypothetical protein CSH36_03285 [Thalassolituus sp.]